MRMFASDAKNYHVWSYRQWLVRRFDLWDGAELDDVSSLLEFDVRNNSAWNYRWFVVFGRDAVGGEGQAVGESGGAGEVTEEVVDREIRVAKDAIALAPQNQSPWNYLRGVFRRAGRSLELERAFAEGFADLQRPDEVRSSHALDFLVDVYAAIGMKDEARRALRLLADRFDPIRKNYWEYRMGLLGADGDDGMAGLGESVSASVGA